MTHPLAVGDVVRIKKVTRDSHSTAADSEPLPSHLLVVAKTYTKGCHKKPWTVLRDINRAIDWRFKAAELEPPIHQEVRSFWRYMAQEQGVEIKP